VGQMRGRRGKRPQAIVAEKIRGLRFSDTMHRCFDKEHIIGCEISKREQPPSSSISAKSDLNSRGAQPIVRGRIRTRQKLLITHADSRLR
jgi:hypothetical protein